MNASVKLSAQAFTLLQKIFFSPAYSIISPYTKHRIVHLSSDKQKQQTSFSIFSDYLASDKNCGIRVAFDVDNATVYEDTEFTFDLLPLKKVKVKDGFVQFCAQSRQFQILDDCSSTDPVAETIELEEKGESYYPDETPIKIGLISLKDFSFTLDYLDMEAVILDYKLAHTVYFQKQDTDDSISVFATEGHHCTHISAPFKWLVKEPISEEVWKGHFSLHYSALRTLSDFVKSDEPITISKSEKLVYAVGTHRKTGAIIETVCYNNDILPKYDKIAPKAESPSSILTLRRCDSKEWLRQLTDLSKADNGLTIITLGDTYKVIYSTPRANRDIALPKFITAHTAKDGFVGINIQYLITALNVMASLRSGASADITLSVYNDNEPVVVSCGRAECYIMPLSL